MRTRLARLLRQAAYLLDPAPHHVTVRLSAADRVELARRIREASANRHGAALRRMSRPAPGTPMARKPKER